MANSASFNELFCTWDTCYDKNAYALNFTGIILDSWHHFAFVRN